MISLAADNKKEFQLWLEDSEPNQTASVMILSMEFLEILLRKKRYYSYLSV